MTGKRKKNRSLEAEPEPIEADREGEVHPWARAFGVSSDALSGAASGEEHLERDEKDPDRTGAK